MKLFKTFNMSFWYETKMPPISVLIKSKTKKRFSSLDFNLFSIMRSNLMIFFSSVPRSPPGLMVPIT